MTRGSGTRSSGTRPRRRRRTTSTACPTLRARGRCATCGGVSPRLVPDVRPGLWLRLTALSAAASCSAAVVSGALELGTAHRALAALALPPLCALVAAAWVAHRRLLAPALGALLGFLAAALLTPRPAHLVLSGLALAASLVAVVECFRGRPAPAGTWWGYVTLTKPRIMSLLLLTGAAGMFVGARGLPSAGTLAATLAGPAPGRGRGERPPT